MANHIHLHLDKVTKDAGTSEGARKAAQTRKQHGSSFPHASSSGYSVEHHTSSEGPKAHVYHGEREIGHVSPHSDKFVSKYHGGKPHDPRNLKPLGFHKTREEGVKALIKHHSKLATKDAGTPVRAPAKRRLLVSSTERFTAKNRGC